jgi:glyceraldehyde-3-phosphate dehydrogenase/erythrose-4-phosphate dehydrogenase
MSAVEGSTLVVNGKRIRLTAVKDPAELKWGEVGADVVVEATGLFLTKESAQKHIDAGAKKVVMQRAVEGRHARCSSTASTTPRYAGQADRQQRELHHQLPGTRWPRS